MPHLTDIIDSAIKFIHEEHNINAPTNHFAEHVSGFKGFTVNFPDGSNRDAPDEEKAEEIARVWLANRMSKQDDASWRPSRETMHNLGITITGLLAVTY